MAKAKSKRHPSALKANRQALAHKEQNYKVRSRVRTLTARVLKDVSSKNKEAATVSFKVAQSAWQKAAKTGIFTKNTASRNIGNLASKVAALSAKA